MHHDVLIIPIGSVEQHGPHLPLIADTLAPIGIVERLADIGRRPILMGVPIHHTYAPESEVYPGTLSLRGATVSDLVADLLVSYGRHDIDLTVLLNGHLESSAFVLEGVRLACERQQNSRHILVVNWWDLVSAQTLERIYPGVWPGWVSEHAAVIETSVMLALYPGLVDTASLPSDGTFPIPPTKRFPIDAERKPRSGSFASAVGSSAEIGSVIVDEVVDALADLVESELGRPLTM